MTSIITLSEIPKNLILLAAKTEEGKTHTPMRDALKAAIQKANPVFVKRGQSILVMERSQFNEIQLAIGEN